jgi:hypothetical protein
VSGFGTGHVFKTVDSGTTWTDVSGDLPDVPVNAVAVDWSATPPALYAGTDAGVLSSTDGGSTWATYGTGLPPVVVMDLQIDTVSATLIAATHGRGAYTIPVASFVPNPGRTSFSASNFSVNESAGTATISVTRTGGTSNPASVDFATTGGTATPGTDYSVTPGTLSWAAGEGGTKTFTVSIVNDTTQEPNETVNFSLSNPVGAALGPTTAATLTINDNDKASYRPDLRIKGSSYIGDNVYNTTGAKQTITVTGKRGTKKTFYFILQNDGAKGDWFKITGTGNSTEFKVAYYQGSSLITTGALKAVLGSASSLVPPGAMSVAVKIVVTVLSSAPHGSTKTVTITAISQKQTTKKDVAKAKTKVP